MERESCSNRRILCVLTCTLPARLAWALCIRGLVDFPIGWGRSLNPEWNLYEGRNIGALWENDRVRIGKNSPFPCAIVIYARFLYINISHYYDEQHFFRADDNNNANTPHSRILQLSRARKIFAIAAFFVARLNIRFGNNLIVFILRSRKNSQRAFAFAMIKSVHNGQLCAFPRYFSGNGKFCFRENEVQKMKTCKGLDCGGGCVPVENFSFIFAECWYETWTGIRWWNF